MVFTFLYAIKSITHLKVLVHLSWNLVTLLTIPLFVLAAAFGILGVSMTYMSGIVDVIFSKEVISKVIEDGMISEVINTCLFEDGDLLKLFVKDKQALKVVGYFDNLYKTSSDLIATSDRIKFSENSFSVSLLTEVLEIRKTDLSQSVIIRYTTDSTAYTEYDTEGEYVLAQLNTFVNKDVEKSKQEKCDSYSKDFFVNKNDDCPDGYDVVLNVVPAEKIGSKMCLIVFQWDKDKLTKRYESRPKGCLLTNYKSVQEAAISHIESITKYTSESNKQITLLSEDVNR